MIFKVPFQHKPLHDSFPTKQQTQDYEGGTGPPDCTMNNWPFSKTRQNPQADEALLLLIYVIGLSMDFLRVISEESKGSGKVV